MLRPGSVGGRGCWYLMVVVAVEAVHFFLYQW